jgi:hypothetical protein
LRITVAAEDAEQRLGLLTARYPQLANCCAIEPRPIGPLPAAEIERGAVLFDPDGGCTVRRCYVCLPEDPAGLQEGRILHRRAPHAGLQTVVCVLNRGGLADLLEQSQDNHEALRTFALLDEACRLEALAESESAGRPELGGTDESLAHAIHQQYVADRLAAGETPEANRALCAWANLRESLRELNRAQARALPGYLAAPRCTIERLADWDAPWFTFSPEEIESLAQFEHARWYAQKTAQGYLYGPARDDVHKTNPNLLPWNDLPAAMQEGNRATVRAWPRLLRGAGFQVRRIGAETGG